MPRHAGLLTLLFFIFLNLVRRPSWVNNIWTSWSQAVLWSTCWIPDVCGSCLWSKFAIFGSSYRKIFVCSQNWMSFQHSSMSIHWYLPVTSVCVISTLDCLGNDGLKWMWCHNRHTRSLFHDGYLSVHSTGLSNFFHINFIQSCLLNLWLITKYTPMTKMALQNLSNCI